jgi:hypothetical protein
MVDRQPRVGLEVGFQVELLKNNLRYRGTILDISEGGIKFNEEDSGLMDGITEGDQRLFGTDVDFYAIRGKGEVKWLLKNEETAGICFLDLEEKSKYLLNDFLRVVV